MRAIRRAVPPKIIIALRVWLSIFITLHKGNSIPLFPIKGKKGNSFTDNLIHTTPKRSELEPILISVSTLVLLYDTFPWVSEGIPFQMRDHSISFLLQIRRELF